MEKAQNKTEKYIKLDIDKDKFTVSMTEDVNGFEVLQAASVLIDAVIQKSMEHHSEPDGNDSESDDNEWHTQDYKYNKEDKMGYTE